MVNFKLENQIANKTEYYLEILYGDFDNFSTNGKLHSFRIPKNGNEKVATEDFRFDITGIKFSLQM